MKQRKMIAGFCLLLTVSSTAVAGGMDEWFVEKQPDQVRWRVPEADEMVAGNQNGWYITPHDIRLGYFGFSSRDGRVKNATAKSFEIIPNCVWGQYTYKVTRLGPDAESTGYEPGRRGGDSRRIAFSEVQKVAEAGKGLRLNGVVTRIHEDRKGFDADIQWAGKKVPCRFEVVKVEREKRIPEFHSVQYGPHWRQTYDVYLPEGFDPKSDEPLGVVLNIHGGGWGALDKQSGDGDRWNRNNIAFISMNYRYIGEYQQPPAVTVPIAAPLLDAARGLQHIKYHAKTYGIDPDRILATGGSAGGASSAWLAMHDDMAEPDSADPIARVSTRLYAATPTQGQLSMDPKQMREWIPEITYGPDKFITDFPAGMGRNDKKARFDYWLSRREEFLPAIREFSAYEHASPDDPPMMLCYGGQKDIPVSEGGNATHHPKFGEYTYKRLKEVGHPEVYYWADNVDSGHERYNGWVGFALFTLDKLNPDWVAEKEAREKAEAEKKSK
jgi:acetyl esterase/lipase